MKTANSISDAIVLHLNERKGEWIAGYELVQKWFYGKFTGVQAQRRAREIAEDGYYIIEGVKYFVERKQGRKYVFYRVAFTETKPKQHATISPLTRQVQLEYK